MSKCSECNQPVPELRAVQVWCSDYVLKPNANATCSYGSIECRVAGWGDKAALSHLLHSGVSLVLVPEEQLNTGPSTDWDVHQLACAKQTVEDLRKRNAELVRKLDDVRRVAKI